MTVLGVQNVWPLTHLPTLFLVLFFDRAVLSFKTVSYTHLTLPTTAEV